MNKSYKSVWNESTGSWVAVSELATGRSKSKRAKTAISKAILTQIAVGGMGLCTTTLGIPRSRWELGAHANNDNTVAIGTNVAAGGIGGVAIGNLTTSGGVNATAIGVNAQSMGDTSVAIGVGVKTQGTNGVAIGDGSFTGANASGTGGDTFVTQPTAGTGDLFVGNAVTGARVDFSQKGGAARELVGVANGTTDNSAVNLAQLKPAVEALGGGAAISAAGVVTGPSYSIGGVAKNNVGDAFKAVDTNLSTLNTSVAAITAGGTGLVVQDKATGDINVGALLNGDKVNFAGKAGDRVLTGVADGAITSSSSDAVNGKQIAGISSSFATAIGGGSVMNTDGTVTIPSFTVGGTTVNNVGDAINKLDTNITNNYTELSSQITKITNNGGVATPNAVAYDSAAKDKLTLGTAGQTTTLTNLHAGDISSESSTDAVTGGQLYATNQDVAALQSSVKNIGTTGSTSIGVNGANGADGKPGAAGAAGATGADAIAMGDKASASGDHSVVIGGGASSSGDGTTVIGGNGHASGKNSTAIGNGATATGANSVALGAGSVADRDNSVSVGSPDQLRQITNVAPGTQGTDAVNLNQMNSAVGGIARKAYSGIAAATALTMIPDVDANKTLSLGIGGGTFQGYAATAIGGTARITQNIKVRVGAGWSAAGTTVGAGASYQW